MSTPALSIAAPAFNEEACIESVVRSWLAMLDRERIHGEIVIVDDGSTDRTAELLAKLAEEDERVRPIEHPENRGYGRALRTAILAARAPWIATMDSDGQFDPDDIPRLMRAQVRSNANVVIGFRRRKADTRTRVLANQGLRAIVRLLFRARFRDTNCALKLLPRDWIVTARLEANGFPTPTEIVILAMRAGLEIAEVGVDHRVRAGGRSKLGLVSTAAEMLGFLIALRLRPDP